MQKSLQKMSAIVVSREAAVANVKNQKIQHMEIIQMLPRHWNDIQRIYKEVLLRVMQLFKTEIPSWPEWDKSHIENNRLAAIENGQIIGWAALTPVSGRCVYAGVAETSVYVSETARGKGLEKNCCWRWQRRAKKIILDLTGRYIS